MRIIPVGLRGHFICGDKHHARHEAEHRACGGIVASAGVVGSLLGFEAVGGEVVEGVVREVFFSWEARSWAGGWI